MVAEAEEVQRRQGKDTARYNIESDFAAFIDGLTDQTDKYHREKRLEKLSKKKRKKNEQVIMPKGNIDIVEILMLLDWMQNLLSHQLPDVTPGTITACETTDSWI